MARVVATRHVMVGNKRIPVKAVRGVMQMLPLAAIEATAVQLRVHAEEAREMVIDKILAGEGRVVVGRPPRISKSKIVTSERKPFTLAKLTAAWARYKELANMDGRTLVATGDYIEGIEVRKADLGDAGVAWGVGLADRDHEPSGLPLEVIARILEKGSAKAKIPARPHWRPTRRIVLRKIREATPGIRAEALRLLLRRAG